MAITAANAPIFNGVTAINFTNALGTNSLVAGAVTPNATSLAYTISPNAAATTVAVTAANASLRSFGLTNADITASDFSVTLGLGQATGSADAVSFLSTNNKLATGTGVGVSTVAFVGGAAGQGFETINVVATGINDLIALTSKDGGGTNLLGTLTMTGTGDFRVDTALTVTSTSVINGSSLAGGFDVAISGVSVTTVTGGAANDIIRFAAADQFTSTDSINLGAGTNTLFLADTAIGGSATSALNAAINAVTTAQVLGVSGAATVDMSGITVRTLSLGATSNFVVQKLEAADKIVVNGVTAGTVDATASLGFNTLNIEMNGAEAVAKMGTLNATSNSTINILSTGVAGTNEIGAITNSANASFVVTGSAALKVTSLHGVATSFNASAATGKITVTGGNAASILTGGSKGDAITGATAAGGDSLLGGAGNDTIGTATVTGTTATVVTGGLGADLIGLNGVATGNKVYTLNATAAESFATSGQFDIITFADHTDTTTSTVTNVTGLLNSTLVGATSVNIGVTTVTAGSFLAVGSASATLTATKQNFVVFQDSNSNGIIDATDFSASFVCTGIAGDTLAMSIVGGQLVATLTGVA